MSQCFYLSRSAAETAVGDSTEKQRIHIRERHRILPIPQRERISAATLPIPPTPIKRHICHELTVCTAPVCTESSGTPQGDHQIHRLLSSLLHLSDFSRCAALLRRPPRLRGLSTRSAPPHSADPFDRTHTHTHTHTQRERERERERESQRERGTHVAVTDKISQPVAEPGKPDADVQAAAEDRALGSVVAAARRDLAVAHCLRTRLDQR